LEFEGGGVSGVINLESPGVGAPSGRLRDDERYHDGRRSAAWEWTAIAAFRQLVDPIESGIRERVRCFIEEMIRAELDEVLARPRYGRSAEGENGESGPGVVGHRHGSRRRSPTGTFGPVENAVPRARLAAVDAKTSEWCSTALRA
jgi:hypothetical protein